MQTSRWLPPPIPLLASLRRGGDRRSPQRPRTARAALRPCAAGPGRHRRGAGRRRADAADAASLHRPRHADLRHESRHRRLPDEHRSGSGLLARLKKARAGQADAAAHGRQHHARPARTRPSPSTRSRCCAPAGRPRASPSRSMAASACPTSIATACWWRRRPARPPTTSPPTARSCRSAPGLLALTPINAFRPRRWRGALLPRHSKVEFTVLDPRKRPVAAAADSVEIANVAKVTVTEATDIDAHPAVRSRARSRGAHPQGAVRRLEHHGLVTCEEASSPSASTSSATRAGSRSLLALVVGTVGGFVFDRLRMPLAWMLGACVVRHRRGLRRPAHRHARAAAPGHDHRHGRAAGLGLHARPGAAARPVGASASAC